MNIERYEQHVIYSYTEINWFYLNEESGFSMQLMSTNNNWPKYFYVIRIKNDGCSDLDLKPWNVWPPMLPVNYRLCIENICFLISLIYWKTFSYVGIFSNNSRYHVLDFSQSKLKYDFLPWDKQDNRIDIKKDINLVKLWPLIKWFFKQIQEDKKILDFCTVASLYHKGIVNSQIDIEISYIDFIRSIEVLNDIFYNNDDLKWEDIYEWKLLQIYNKIKDEKDLAKYFKKIHWSTRKFLDTVLKNLVIKDIHKTESKWEDFWLQILDSEKIKKSIKNAYEVRSSYIHSWSSFWTLVLPDQKWLNELICWDWKWNDSLKIQITLSLLWLERIVRNTLLNYFNKNIGKD